MDDLAALTHQLEYLFLKKIIAGLRNKSIGVSEAKIYANAFLGIEPFESSEETYIKIMEFAAKHPQFTDLKDYMNAYQREKNDLIKITKMREYMKQNNMDAALAVAQA